MSLCPFDQACQTPQEIRRLREDTQNLFVGWSSSCTPLNEIRNISDMIKLVNKI